MSHWNVRIAEYQEMWSIIQDMPGIRKSTLAKLLKVEPSTVDRRLPALEEIGALLSEDESGKLYVFHTEKGFPHTRGGEPKWSTNTRKRSVISPHTWG